MENLDRSNNKSVSLSLIAEYGSSDTDSDTETNDNTGNDDSDVPELSEMVLKNNIINACAHGPLSRPSAVEETTRHMIIDSSESAVVEYEVTEYGDDDSDSDSSDSDVNSVKDVEEISSSEENDLLASAKPKAPKVQGELDLDDLPPVEDLAISLPPEGTFKIGTISSIVDKLVVVRALPNTPVVDLETVLFIDNGNTALGKVFDVFGPVTEPRYCVRFNSTQHAQDRGAAPGVDVFLGRPYARVPHTKFLLLAQLMSIKGSDASWVNDLEPPPSQIEYSDDEEERKAKKEQKQNRQQQEDPDNGETSKNQGRKVKNQRPSECSSRFGNGLGRGRNPFAAGSRRNCPNQFPRFARPWLGSMDLRTPPQHPSGDPGGPYSAPPNFPANGPIFPTFNPNTPPPYRGNSFQYGSHARLSTPPGFPPQFRHNNGPFFGGSLFSSAGAQPQWVNGPPPPPGT